jgi:hypothetical protein
MELIISLISGALGGNVAGALLKNFSLGRLLNAVVGVVGGGLGGQLLGIGGPMMGAEGGFDVGALIGNVAGSGVGGGTLIVIVGAVKSIMSRTSAGSQRIPDRRSGTKDKPKRFLGKVFISYRRGPTSSIAGRLYDRLAQKIPLEQLFMDVDAVAPGEDFRQAIDAAIGQSVVLLAIVGEDWLEGTDSTSERRRLDQPNDFVRLEIETAIKHGLRVIPVLVDNATMPSENDLPASIKAFAWRNSVEVRHTRFNDDVDSLVDTVRKLLKSEKTEQIGL